LRCTHSFRDLCEQALAAADYLRIRCEFHSIVLDHIRVVDYSHAPSNARARPLLLRRACNADNHPYEIGLPLGARFLKDMT
jgi:hypothetical protein